MRSVKLLRPIIYLGAAGLLVFLFIFIFNYKDSLNRYGFAVNIRTAIFERFTKISSVISGLKTMGKLNAEIDSLQKENLELLHALASFYNIEEENEFLRSSLGLDSLTEYDLNEARIFNVQFTPKGHYLLLNKGRADDMAVGNIVISSSGILIGQITEVFENSSKVSLITNPDMKLTVRVLGKDTTGIVRGLLDQGLGLEFVSQNDAILENDTIVTSGNDLFPPGLIIGGVRKIELNDGNIFKNIIIEPEFNSIKLDRVLVIKH